MRFLTTKAIIWSLFQRRRQKRCDHSAMLTGTKRKRPRMNEASSKSELKK